MKIRPHQEAMQWCTTRSLCSSNVQCTLKQQSTALHPFKTQDFWGKGQFYVGKGISPGDLGPLHGEATLYFLTSPWIWKGNIWKADDIFHKLPSRFCVVLENVYSRECPQQRDGPDGQHLFCIFMQKKQDMTIHLSPVSVQVHVSQPCLEDRCCLQMPF